MILGVKKDTKFFYLAFPTFILGFFTRYTVIFTLPLMLIFILFLENPFKYIKKHFKNLFGGIIAGLISTIPFLLYYYIYNIPLFFLSQSKTISAETAGYVSTATIAKGSVFYYLNNLAIYISTSGFPPYSLKPGKFLFDKMMWIGGNPSLIGYLFVGILVIGLIIYIYNLFKKDKRVLMFNQKNINIKLTYLKIFLFLILFSLFILSFNKISVIYSLIIFSIAILALYRILYKAEIKNFKLDFLVLYWFMVNLIFFSSHLMKVSRYFIALTPALAYLIILSIHLIFEKVKSFKLKQINDLNKANQKNMEKIDLKGQNHENVVKVDLKGLNYNNREKINLNFHKAKIITSILLIAILTIFTASCFSNQPVTYDDQRPTDILYASQNEKDLASWLINYDSNYESKITWADRGGDFSFYLKKNIPSIDSISNQTNFTSELLNENVTYFISNGPNNNIYGEYILLKNIGNVYLYKMKL